MQVPNLRVEASPLGRACASRAKQCVEERKERVHWIEAEEAEFNKQWFAAAFHLRWALKKEPGSEELKKRLAAAEQKLKEEQEAAKQVPMPADGK